MSSKRRLDTAYNPSGSSGNQFLKAENGYKIGGTVLDSGGRKVGIVFDLFVPVPSPFSRALTMTSSDMPVSPSSWG